MVSNNVGVQCAVRLWTAQTVGIGLHEPNTNPNIVPEALDGCDDVSISEPHCAIVCCQIDALSTSDERLTAARRVLRSVQADS